MNIINTNKKQLELEIRVRNYTSPVSRFFILGFSKLGLKPSVLVVAMGTLSQSNSNIFYLVSVNNSPLAEIQQCTIVQTQP